MKSPAVLAFAAAFVLPTDAFGQEKRYGLESPSGLRLHNVAAEAATLTGKKGVKLVIAPETMARLRTMTPEQQNQLEQLAVIEGSDFANGVIEAEIAGSLALAAGPAARGFVGIAFRVQPDMKTYDAFYLRPTNGRADDQERRNHAAQYIAHPQWTWNRLRTETPSKYEAYVDLVPGEWTKVRIEVRGEKARLFVHDQPHATLVVNDVKSGVGAKGAVALWVGPGTVAYFRNLSVRAEP